jgi:predicted small lipoprotein YifL
MIKKIAIISLMAFCLSACGIKGSLDTAPPMWGKAKQDYETKKQQEQQEQSNQTEK